MNHREVFRKQVFACDDMTVRSAALGDKSGHLLQFGRTEITGRRVDEVTTQPYGVRDGSNSTRFFRTNDERTVGGLGF